MVVHSFCSVPWESAGNEGNVVLAPKIYFLNLCTVFMDSVVYTSYSRFCRYFFSSLGILFR